MACSRHCPSDFIEIAVDEETDPSEVDVPLRHRRELGDLVSDIAL